MNNTIIKIESLEKKYNNKIAFKDAYMITREFMNKDECPDSTQELILSKKELPDLIKIIMDELIK